MIDVELIYMKNIEKDGEIIDAAVISREIISVGKATKAEIEKHIELDDADFVDVYIFRDGQWVYAGSYTEHGWVFSVLP